MVKHRRDRNIGVSTTFLKRTMIRTERGSVTILDEKLVEDVLQLLGLGSSTKALKMPGKLIKRTEETLQELEGEDIELYRNTTGKLIYLMIDRRELKCVAKELARRMQKTRKVDMELLKAAGRYLPGRRHFGSVVGTGRRSGSLRQRQPGLPRDQKEHIKLVFDVERTGSGYGVVCARGSSNIERGGRAQGNDCGRYRDVVRNTWVEATLRDKREKILWADSSACKSFLTRLGPGRLKRLEAAQLRLQEKTWAGEVRMKAILRTHNQRT